MSGAERLTKWSRCSQCRSCEYNYKLLKNDKKCLTCGKQVKLFESRPRSSDRRVAFEVSDHKEDGNQSDQSSDQGRRRQRSPGRNKAKAKNSDLDDLLAKAVDSCGDDSELRAVLDAQRIRLQGQAPVHDGSEVDSVKRADGAWKQASHKHQQLVTQVLRLRRQLQGAEAKEQAAALDLAKAEVDKKNATIALAQAEGIKPAADEFAEGKGVHFSINMNPEVFEKFEQWDCEDSDKESLRNLKKELQTMQESFAEKDAKLQTFMTKLDAVKKDVEDRMGKKRKTNDGEAKDTAQEAQGKPPTTTPSTPSPPAASTANEEQLQREAARLSAAKFEAVQKAQTATATKATASKAAGKGKKAEEVVPSDDDDGL